MSPVRRMAFFAAASITAAALSVGPPATASGDVPQAGSHASHRPSSTRDQPPIPMPEVRPSEPGPVALPNAEPSEPGPVPMPQAAPPSRHHSQPNGHLTRVGR